MVAATFIDMRNNIFPLSLVAKLQSHLIKFAGAKLGNCGIVDALIYLKASL